MHARIAGVALFTVALSCGGEQANARAPSIAASQAPPQAPLVFRCPAGTTRRSDAVCEATTPLAAPGAKVTGFVTCASPHDVFSIATGRAAPPFAKETCGNRREIEFLVAPGHYYLSGPSSLSNVVVTGDEARVDLFGRYSPPSWIVLEDWFRPGDDIKGMSRRPLAVDAAAKDGVLEVTLAQIDPGATALDQIVLEDGGEIIAPDDEAAGALADSDGRGVVVPSGTKLTLRFRVGARAFASKPQFLGRGQALARGEAPQLYPVDTLGEDADVCPGGASASAKGCEASEPLIRPDDERVRTTFYCVSQEHGILPSARVPEALDAATRARLYAEANAEQASGRAAVVPCSRDVTVDLLPGEYGTFQRAEPTGPARIVKTNRVVYVLPKTPQRFELEYYGTTHCPAVSSWNARTGTFLPPVEFANQQDAREKRATRAFDVKGFAQDGVVTLRVSEAEPEDAYVDELRVEWKGHVILPREGGARSVLARADGRVLHLGENRQATVTYALPERVTGAVDLTVVAFAHYIRK